MAGHHKANELHLAMLPRFRPGGTFSKAVPGVTQPHPVFVVLGEVNAQSGIQQRRESSLFGQNGKRSVLRINLQIEDGMIEFCHVGQLRGKDELIISSVQILSYQN
ncbi:hypothetical protein SDC9_71805 [bioreactor metagenome]|uniref:Uncharacterized protein n=1 Tax=bioreactor metagenome TaxID=1076179 RepID=A0A644YGS6_9ZZZZ